MADQEHLKILNQGEEAWNNWREREFYATPQLRDIDFSGIDIGQMDLSRADLSGANFNGRDLSNRDLTETDLTGAKLNDANLSKSRLVGSNLYLADLVCADLRFADLQAADFRYANLSKAKLQETYLGGTNFTGANLFEAAFDRALFNSTIFGDNDLRIVTGLESINHNYSSKDEEFGKRLAARMREANVRVWFAAEDVMGGEKTLEQVAYAIETHDRLLLVLSLDSLHSE